LSKFVDLKFFDSQYSTYCEFRCELGCGLGMMYYDEVGMLNFE